MPAPRPIRRVDVIDELRACEPELRWHGVETLYLFGSVARDEAGPASDVDLFFDYADPRFSLVALVRARDRIAEILSLPVHLATRDSLHPDLKEGIERSAVRVY